MESPRETRRRPLVSGILPADYARLVLHRFADDFASAVRVERTPLEHPGPGEVLVRNAWAGVNGVLDDRIARNRVPFIAAAPGMDLGVEAVGEIAALGAGVTDLEPGDAVATVGLGGAYREYHRVEAADVYPVPAATPEVLTLIPTGISALVGLERVAELRAGERIVISAAAGGLGHLLVQLSLLTGAEVVALAGSDAKCAAVSELGAQRVINYRDEDPAAVFSRDYRDGFDVAYDTVGGPLFDLFVEHLAPRGRLVVSGFTADIDDPEAVLAPRIYTRLYWKAASVRAFMNHLFPEHHADARERLLRLHANGDIRVLVDPTAFRGLGAVAPAVAHLLARRNLGKVVVALETGG